MNKRQFALSALAFVVALALVSCEPLRGSAAEIGYEEQAGIYDYLNAGTNGLINIDFRLDEDSDGNRSKRLQIYALQSGMLNTQTHIYDNMDFSIAPDTVSVSGTYSAGLYRSALDNQIHAVSLASPPALGEYGLSTSFTMATSDEFSLTVLLNSSDNPIRVVSRHFNDGSYFPNYYNGYTSFSIATFHGTIGLQSNSYFTGFTHSEYRYGEDGLGFTISNENYIPVNPRDMTFNLGQITNLGGTGVSTSLPNDSVDTDKPWEYYNNVLLPYIEQNFSDVPNLPDYLIFPDGYDEPVQPTTVPVVYPTLPGFDYALETNGTEPSTDVNYSVPDMPGKDIAVPAFDFTQINPREVMAPVAGGLRGIWELIGMVLTEYGLFPYVGLAIFAAIVFALLRLGK